MWAGKLGFDSRQKIRCFLLHIVQNVLGPIWLLIQGVPGILFSEVERLEGEADPSPPFTAKVRNTWRYTSTIKYLFMA
jgi:hypothetical protein